MSFLSEIKRRKIIQVAAVYAAVAWLLIQIVGSIEAPLSLPDWFDTVVILLLALGFPIALILSWAYDLTPSGVVRDQGNREQSRATTTEAVDVPVEVVHRRPLDFQDLVAPAEVVLPEPLVGVLPHSQTHTAGAVGCREQKNVAHDERRRTVDRVVGARLPRIHPALPAAPGIQVREPGPVKDEEVLDSIDGREHR